MLIVVLSKGYFLSRNCLREIHAAVKLRKPLALLHEANTKRGGAPLSELYDECPAELRDAVFGPRDAPKEVVTWHRERHLQQVTFVALVTIGIVAASVVVAAVVVNIGVVPRCRCSVSPTRFSRPCATMAT